MALTVTIREKKKFLLWFLRNYAKKDLKLSWFLEQLIADERALFYLHIVNSLDTSNKSLRMTVNKQGKIDYVFNKGHLKRNDLDIVYHDMQLNKTEPLYVQFLFTEAAANIKLYPVLEDRLEHLQKKTRVFLSASLYEKQVQLLKEAIDQALMHYDEELFMKYTKALKVLQAKQHRFLNE